jgi:hypothetical protein
VCDAQLGKRRGNRLLFFCLKGEETITDMEMALDIVAVTNPLQLFQVSERCRCLGDKNLNASMAQKTHVPVCMIITAYMLYNNLEPT